MNSLRKAITAALVLSALAVSGCSVSDSSTDKSTATSDVASEVTSEVTTTTGATITETLPEEPEKEKPEVQIAGLIPDGYGDKRENTAYSSFQKYTYYSSTAGRDTNVNVLLPPDYSEDKQYPVLYILHGFYDNEDWMARSVVNLSTIYGNLLADGEAEEMIIVLPYIFCDKDMPYCTGMDLDNCLAYDNFINDLTTDLMPFIESSFSVAKGRENTAITGFSMGGRESLFIGFKHPELFGYVGAVCPAPGLVKIPSSPMHPGQITKDEMTFGDNQPEVVLISYSKSDGTVGNNPADYCRIMTENGVQYLTHIMERTGHDHSSVKPHLYNFLRMLFKQD